MRRDKQFAIFLIIVSFAVAGVLQTMRSTDKEYNLPYMATLESSLVVLDEKCSNELNTYSGLNTEEEILTEEYIIEEQEIIEEFTDQKEGEPVSYDKEPEASISFINDNNVSINPYFSVDILKLQTLEAAVRESKDFLENQKVIASIKENGVTHKIKTNDNLYNLAIKYYNDQSKWTNIYQANKTQLMNPNSLKIGQELLIPDIKTSKENIQKETPQVPVPLVHKHIL